MLMVTAGSRRLFPSPGVVLVLVGVTAGIGGLAATSPRIALALGATCVLLYLALRFPIVYMSVFAAVILLLPLTVGMQLSPSLPVIFPSRLLLVIGIIGAAIRALRRQRTSRCGVAAYAVVFLVAMALSLISSIGMQASIFRFFAILLEWFGTAAMTWELLSDPAEAFKFMWVLHALLAVVLVLGLVQEINGFSLSHVIDTGYVPYQTLITYLQRAGTTRVQSTFAQPVEYGAFLALVLPFQLGFYSIAASPFRQVCCALLILLSLVNLALTLSLGPILAFFVALIVYIMLVRRSKLTLGFAFSALILVLLVMGPFWQQFQVLVVNRFDPTTGSGGNVAGRLAILAAVTGPFAARPWTGFGLNTWYILNPYGVFDGIANSIGGAGNENMYAQVLVETGVLGLSSCLLLLWGVARELWLRLRASSSEATRNVLRGMLAGTLGFYVVNFTANVFNALQVVSVFWVLVFCCLRVAERGRIDRVKSKCADQSHAPIVPFIGVRGPRIVL